MKTRKDVRDVSDEGCGKEDVWMDPINKVKNEVF